MIGTASLPAGVVDIGISSTAVNEAADCPARACADAEPAVLRLYRSDVRYDGKNHLLAIGIEGQDRADLKAFLAIDPRCRGSRTPGRNCRGAGAGAGGGDEPGGPGGTNTPVGP
jgi:hypothetical protein